MEMFFNLIRPLVQKMPSTVQLQAFGLTQVPLLFMVLPKVEHIDDTKARVRINLNWLTRNHLKSMYFGTQAIGADCVVAVLALHVVQRLKGVQVVPVFKNFEANFLKRAESDVAFICDEGQKIWTMVEAAHKTGQRVTDSIAARAVNAKNHEEVYSQFSLGLSVKIKV